MRVLAISAHPDDETMGCGATLHRHRAEGDDLFWLILTKAHEPAWSSSVIREKEREVAAVSAAYGMKETFWPGLPSGTLADRPLSDILHHIRETVNAVKPDVVYTVHPGDIHTDHRTVFTAVTVALKPFATRAHGVRRILTFECLSSTDAAPPLPSMAFQPNHFRDVSAFIDRKIETMSLFKTEVQPELLPRSSSAIRALARMRGASVGVEYAEAFHVIREVS